ncbi:hypothetical protein SDC9_174632 [bioreactor metagenome]|uniref:Uncharacterized protein n=1 Tax=bioreactor metagenome TaxID=1076179 RepID=A0A645GKF8_9ZZZZ
MRSRCVMAEPTVRESSSKTLAITCCSRAASTPARAPASVMARMSSEVMLSSRIDGRPSSLKIKSVVLAYSHTTGLNSFMHHSMGPGTRTAQRSGSAMPRRLGSRSANRMNSEVTMKNEHRKPSVCAVDCCVHSANRRLSEGLKAPSPTIPPRIATAFCPTCTTVK